MPETIDIGAMIREASDAQLRVAIQNTTSDLVMAEKYEHNAHLRPGIRAHLDKLTAERESRAARASAPDRAPENANGEPLDPRTLVAEVRRVFFLRNAHCTVSDMQRNQMVSTGEVWMSREKCGAPAGYATVKKGRVSPRCERHAREDAKAMGISVNEDMVMQRRAPRAPGRATPTEEKENG